MYHYLMKTNAFYFLVFIISFTACKKNSVDVSTGAASTYADSISFSINGKSTVFSERNSSGSGNRQINIKPSMALIDGREWEYQTGGFYWYGEKDSLLYDKFYGFNTKDNTSTINISFSRKYHRNVLKEVFPVLAPADNSEIFKVGRQPFAIDLNLENTREGISIEVRSQELGGQLSTYIPAFSILIRTDLDMNIQKNSIFEITKVQKLNESLYLLEGNFDVNLFDRSGKLYRLERGFFRFKASMRPDHAVELGL
jgi:hypothetical protein